MTKGSYYRFQGSLYNASAEPLHTEVSIARKNIEMISRGTFSRGVGSNQSDWTPFDSNADDSFTATMENGILTITLKQELPEEKKPKTIKIK